MPQCRYRYVFDGEQITEQTHDTPPQIGYEVTFIGRLGQLARAEHFVVVEVSGTEMRLERK